MLNFFLIIVVVFVSFVKFTRCDLLKGGWPSFRNDRRNSGYREVPPAGNDRNEDMELKPFSVLTNGGIFSTPVVSDTNEVYVGGADTFFYKIDGVTGEIIWKFRTGEVVDSAAALDDGNKVIFASADGNVYCLNRESGEVIWKFQSEFVNHDSKNTKVFDDIYCSRFDKPQVGISEWFEGNVMIGNNDQVFAGCDDFRMYSLDINTGDKIYSVYNGLLGSVWANPSISAEGVVIYGNLNFRVVAINESDGSCLWQSFFSNMISSSSAQTKDGRYFFVGSWNWKLYKMEVRTGATVWKFATGNVIYSSPAIDEEKGIVLVTSTDGLCYCLDMDTGEKLWSFDSMYSINSSPSIRGDVVYFGNAEGKIFALDTKNGDFLWSFDTSLEGSDSTFYINSSPALGETMLYVGVDDGQVVGLPYGYCLQFVDDKRCQSARHMKDDLVTMLYINSGGKHFEKSSFEDPLLIERNQIFMFKTVVRINGSTVPSYLNKKSKIEISLKNVNQKKEGKDLTKYVDVRLLGKKTNYIIVRLDEHFLLESKEVFKMEIRLEYTNFVQRGAIESTFFFQTKEQTELLSKKEVFSLRNLNLLNPAVLVSFNQIGFHSYVQLCGKVLERNQGRDFLVVCIPGNLVFEPEASLPTRTLLVGRRDHNTVSLLGKSLRMVTGGPDLHIDEVLYKGTLSNDEKLFFNKQTPIYGRVNCFKLSLQSLILLYLGLCNSKWEFETFGGIDSFVLPEEKSAILMTSQQSSFHCRHFVQESFFSSNVLHVRCNGVGADRKDIFSVFFYEIDDVGGYRVFNIDYYKETSSLFGENSFSGLSLRIPMGMKIFEGETRVFVLRNFQVIYHSFVEQDELLDDDQKHLSSVNDLEDL